MQERKGVKGLDGDAERRGVVLYNVWSTKAFLRRRHLNRAVVCTRGKAFLYLGRKK